MKNFKAIAALAWTAAGAFAQTNGMTAMHPGYTVSNIQPAGRSFLVGGLGTFSDGRLAVCNWGNPGDVWILANADKGQPTATQFAKGLRQVLGCTVVHDTLYVLQMDELTQLVDVDKDGKADEYNKVNDNFAASESNLAYAYDLEYRGGAFYATLSSDVQIGGMDFNPSFPGRSVFLRLHRDNRTDILSSGFRNPNGMGKGFGNRLFSVDNQGSWVPSSKILHLQEGRFYGHKNNAATPFQELPETWPVAWLPHGEVSYNPGDLLFIPDGIFKNQFFYCDLQRSFNGRIYRIAMQEVDGVMQGAVLPFATGFGVGSSRMAWGPNNTLYVGELGSTGGWSSYSTLAPGLKRIAGPADIDKPTAFEILTVRSTGAGTLELEFTEPPASDAVDPAKYTVRHWTFQPQAGYGEGNKTNIAALAVQSATLKPDGKTVELRISGLKEKYQVHISLPSLRSAAGGALWTPQAWFNLNKFGPGAVPPIAGCRDPSNRDYDPRATVSDPGSCDPTVPVAIGNFAGANGRGSSGPLQYLGRGLIRLDLAKEAPYALSLADVAGRELKSWQGRGPADLDCSAFLRQGQGAPRGIHFLKLRSGSGSWSKAVLFPL